MCWSTPICDGTTSLTRRCLWGRRSRRWPKCRSRCRRLSPRSQAIAAKRSSVACGREQLSPTTTAIGSYVGRRTGGSSTSHAPSPSTWNQRPSPPRGSECACLTGRFSASPTNRYTVRSSCQERPTPFTNGRLASICRSASPPLASCRARTTLCTHVSSGVSTNHRSGETLADHHHLRADVHAAIEVDRVHVAHADAARRDMPANFRRLVRAMDADKGVLVVDEEIKSARAEWI